MMFDMKDFYQPDYFSNQITCHLCSPSTEPLIGALDKEVVCIFPFVQADYFCNLIPCNELLPIPANHSAGALDKVAAWRDSVDYQHGKANEADGY